MKKNIILCTALAFALSVLNVNAGNSPAMGNKEASKKTVAKKAKVFLNMQGPTTVSFSGGPYTYTAHVYTTQLPADAKWVISSSGNPNIEIPAGVVTALGYTSITLDGADFGSTGGKHIHLVGTTDDGYGTIFANTIVNVTP